MEAPSGPSLMSDIADVKLQELSTKVFDHFLRFGSTDANDQSHTCKDLPAVSISTGSHLQKQVLEVEFTQIESDWHGTKQYIYHTLTTKQISTFYQTDLSNGLSQSEAKVRLDSLGANVIGGANGVSPVRLFLRHLFNFMLALLWVFLDVVLQSLAINIHT